MFGTTLLARLSKWARTIIFVTACVAGVVALLAGAGVGVDNRLRVLRYENLSKQPSGQIVLVTIDTHSVNKLGAWPWPRARHGELVRELDRAGADRIVFNIFFDQPATDPAQDRLFARALADAKADIVLPAFIENPTNSAELHEYMPTAALLPFVTPVGASLVNDGDFIFRRAPLNMQIDHGTLPGMVQALARTDFKDAGTVVVDWSYEPHLFKKISYADVIAHRYPAGFFRGRTVLVGYDAYGMGDRIAVPHLGPVSSLFFFASGAETLLHGRPLELGGILPLAFAFLVIGASLALRTRWRHAALASGALGFAALQVVTEYHSSVHLDVGAAILAFSAALLAQSFLDLLKAILDRITKSAEAGLPNRAAMEMLERAEGLTVVVCLRNYVETTALLGYAAQGRLLNKIRDRLILAAGHERIYQIDNHSFAWRSREEVPEVVGSIEGLEALFAPGIHVDQVSVDITLNAGLCDDQTLSVEEALPKATLAATNAAASGSLWERYETQDDEVFWKLSILTEFEAALERGQIWVAYQPKLDLHLQAVTGAEALIRWQHPERGFIRPDRFVRAVEDGGRIEKLTLYVLERAIADFAPLGQSIAVNISTRMLGKNRLEDPIREFLTTYGMAAERLTLEITESAAMTGDGGMAELTALRNLGVKISIDDYGTGQSTLSYLKRLPATELKIDQSFVRQILTSRSDAVLINSTIKLAHELDMTTVAEGVEDQATLSALAAIECDIIQGYHIGRPVALADYVRNHVPVDKRQQVA